MVLISINQGEDLFATDTIPHKIIVKFSPMWDKIFKSKFNNNKHFIDPPIILQVYWKLHSRKRDGWMCRCGDIYQKRGYLCDCGSKALQPNPERYKFYNARLKEITKIEENNQIQFLIEFIPIIPIINS